MAALINNSLVCSNTTAATFRAWCTFVHNLFMLGFINVTDAGQIDFTTVATPTSTNMVMGYKIYKTNDALTPVYFKVEFGCAATALSPSISITIGTGYTAGGTISGLTLLSRTQITSGNSDNATAQTCFGSGDINRVCFALFTSTTLCPLMFSFERRKDITIADVDTGVIIDWSNAGNTYFSLCAPFTGVIPVKENGFQFILTTNNPAAYGNVVPQGLRIPCLGPSEPPGMNMAFCNSYDYGAYAEPVLTINLTTVKFKHGGQYINALRGSNTGNNDVNTRLLLRYD